MLPKRKEEEIPTKLFTNTLAYKLTKNQIQRIGALKRKGLPNSAIALEMQVSDKTVAYHLKALGFKPAGRGNHMKTGAKFVKEHSDELIEVAVERIKAGKTITKAAEEIGIPKSSLASRLQSLVKKKLSKKPIGQNVIPLTKDTNLEAQKKQAREHHLIIPDSHSRPGIPNTRFTILGNYIVSAAPTKLINLGDMNDAHSLSGFDIGKKSFEGRRYSKDVAHFRDAQNKLFHPIGLSDIDPMETHFLQGNHEERVDRAVNSDPKLEGSIGMEDLNLNSYWQYYYPLKDIALIDGIAYAHYMTAGNADRALSGLNHAKSLIDKKHMSCVVGHSHMLDFSQSVTGEGKRLFGIVAGCWLDNNQVEDWVAKNVQQNWWRGITEIFISQEGSYSFKFTSMAEIYEKFS
jgi:hypothetical protein